MMRALLAGSILSLAAAAPAAAEGAAEGAAGTVQLDEAEKAWLAEHPVIRLAVDIDWAPFEFVDEANRYRGMAAEYIGLVEERLGLSFQIDKERPWPEMVQAVKDRELDAFSLVVETPQRLEYVTFTRPYISFPMVIVTRETEPFIDGLGDLRGRPVGVVESYATHELLSINHPDLDLVPKKTLGDGLEALSGGEIYAFVDNVAAVGQVIREMGYSNLKVSGQTPYRFELSMAVRNDWPELIPILQKALDSISEPERDAIYNRWIRVKYQEEADYRLLFLLAGAASIVVVILFASNRRLKREIEERRDIENALRESEDRFRSLVEAAPVCIHEVDRKGRLASMNRAGLRMMGVDDEAEVCGLDYLSVPIEAERPRIRQCMEEAFDGSVSYFDFTAEGPDGQIHFTSCFAPILNDRGEVDRLMGITQDVTERWEAEQARERAVFEAEEATRAKSEFLATASHELRTPLNAIIGFSQMIAGEVAGKIDNPKYVDYARDIESSGSHLLSIINDILDLSRIESGKIVFEPKPVSVGTAVNDVAALVVANGRRVRERISIDIPDDIPRIVTDERSFRQVMINILSNADKYTPKTGTIRVTAKASDRGGVRIEISDNGVGIPSEDLDIIFEPFGQSRKNPHIASVGTGLGLPIAKQLVQLQGGDLSIRSAVDEGTTVILDYPEQPAPSA